MHQPTNSSAVEAIEDLVCRLESRADRLVIDADTHATDLESLTPADRERYESTPGYYHGRRGDRYASPPWIIMLVDPTTLDGVQVISAAIAIQGRTVPAAWVDFEYPWKTVSPSSQDTIERYLVTGSAEAAHPRGRLLRVFDRGRQPFLLRAPAKVFTQAVVRGRHQRLSGHSKGAVTITGRLNS